MAVQELIVSLNCQPTDGSHNRSHPDPLLAHTRLSPLPIVRCK
jgi:hypothetical protein